MSFAVTNIKKQNKNILIVEPSATAVLCRFSFKCLIFFFQGMFEVELCPHWYIENFRAHRHLFYVRTEGHWTPKYRVLSIKPLSLHFHRHRGVGRAEHRVQQMRNLYSLLQSQRAWNFASAQPSSPLRCSCTDQHPGSLLHAHAAWERSINRHGPRTAAPAPPHTPCSGPFGETTHAAVRFT